jgi:DNA repair exonuclease SbcCD ATPase subunit
MTEQNPDIAALHRSLVELLDTLTAKQEEATDPATIQALSLQMREVAFRMTNAQRALFKQQTAAIASAVSDANQAKADVDKAIAKIEQINKVIQTVTKFLGLVDKVLDVAKLV